MNGFSWKGSDSLWRILSLESKTQNNKPVAFSTDRIRVDLGISITCKVSISTNSLSPYLPEALGLLIIDLGFWFMV